MNPSDKPKAVVLVSGGLDSCVTAAIASSQYDMAFLHLNYGQRTEKRELQAFKDIADHYEVNDRLVVDITHLKTIGGSSLTDDSMAVHEANLSSTEVPTSYVPFRNANILSIAVSWAEVLGAEKIFIGAVCEDASGYPDCRPEFYAAYNEVIRTGTKPDTHLGIITPIINLSKKEIVERGVELKAPVEKTWSCYQSEDEACGHCDSCGFRLRGFQQAGIEDPIVYSERPNYLSDGTSPSGTLNHE